MARPSPPKPRTSVRDYRRPPDAPSEAPGAFTAVSFVVPGKPMSVNRSTTPIVRGGRTLKITSREGREYVERVQVAARQAMAGRPLLSGDLLFEVIAYWPRRGADSDGPLKPSKDACQGVVFANDSCVVSDRTWRRHDPENPRTVITVSPATPVVSRVLDADEVAAVWAEGKGL